MTDCGLRIADRLPTTRPYAAGKDVAADPDPASGFAHSCAVTGRFWLCRDKSGRGNGNGNGNSRTAEAGAVRRVKVGGWF
jgi:hypothetical protein